MEDIDSQNLPEIEKSILKVSEIAEIKIRQKKAFTCIFLLFSNFKNKYLRSITILKLFSILIYFHYTLPKLVPVRMFKKYKFFYEIDKRFD